MSRPVIKVDNVSKAYAVYQRPMDMILESIKGKRLHDEFWALRDVSFSVHEGQRLGIIGPNGSGKSTLLKILTSHLLPTYGQVEVNGKISAMLSLNTVLNPEETGLSNIRFNLLLNGSPKSEIDNLVDDIIEFTELGPFIYAPVKTYSSGMNAKLAFALSTAIKPEILVIDEVLSVGDAYFVGKATKRMIDLCDHGKALIFVSHSNAAVQMLCDTVLWLDNGGVRMYGPAEQVLKKYEEDFRRQEDVQTRAGNALRAVKLAHQVVPGEVESASVYRLRLRQAQGGVTFEDTHYVRQLRVLGEGLTEESVLLSIAEALPEPSAPQLDILGSEWGRFYNKDGHDCRILSARTGRNKGGQLLMPLPVGGTRDIWSVTVSFEYVSILGREELTVEVLDYLAGTWCAAKQIERSLTTDGWQRVDAQVVIPLVAEDAFHEAVARANENERPDIVIGGVEIIAEDEAVRVLNERVPFSVRVSLIVNRPTDVADVGIKIMRSDGTYMFWQSSGLVGQNIRCLHSDCLVTFSFDVNHFAAGDYQLSAYVANGWDFPENYPYSEVFERKVGILNFTVSKEIPGLDFGAINQRVPVTVHLKEV